MFMALRPELEERGIDPTAPLTIVAVMAAGIVGGWLLYWLVETPFTRLRERWFPARARGAAGPGASSNKIGLAAVANDSAA
jgi:peptidoglycan/LPS O-acetylase OafA/YrhL